MNFFKSILSEDPDPPKPENSSESDPDSPLKPPRDDRDPDAAGGWSFGGLIKTLAIDSVIETYRRDLQEFGSGLKKETEIFRETASRAVKDLPASLEASAAAAQDALGGVIKSTAEIISRESLGFSSDGESDAPGTNLSSNSARYSWFDSQLGAIQSDSSTFCEDPEDVEEYMKWKLGFELGKNMDEIDSLIGENGILENVYKRLVPSTVDKGTFFCRYFYRVDKLKQQESVRANLVKRAISVDDEEELSWDFDEEDGNESGVNLKKENAVGDNNVAIDGNLKPLEKQELKIGSEDDNVVKTNVVESSKTSKEKEVKSEAESDEKLKSEECMEEKNDEKVSVEQKSESLEKNDSSVMSSLESKEEEEDLEWDEIEDIGSGDETKVSSCSSNKIDLRKRLSVGKEDDEDLSWDIEDDVDDDEPVKR